MMETAIPLYPAVRIYG